MLGLGAALVGGAVKLIGGAADRRQANKNYKRNDLIKVMKDAKKAGFHPLEALRSGYAGQQAAQAPRISTMSVAAGAVDAAASIYRDEMMREKQTQLIDAELKDIENRTAERGTITAMSNNARSVQPRLASNNVPTIQTGPFEGQPETELKPMESYALGNGRTSESYVLGPDMDEWLMGQAIKAKDWMDTASNNFNLRISNRYQENSVHGGTDPNRGQILWPYEMGDEPSEWSEMNQIERQTYLHRKNPELFNIFR